MTIGNQRRRDTAFAAVKAFRDDCNGSPINRRDGMSEAIGDLIGNLCHLAAKHKLDPLELVRNGLSHYAVECVERDGMATDARVTVEIDIRRHASGATFKPFTKFSVRAMRAELRKEMAKEFGAQEASEMLELDGGE